MELDEYCSNCYYINRTNKTNQTTKDGEVMILKIDFESEEALYTQLCNQIIMGIATDMLHEGDSLPSVRQLAEEIGINMHTVNKAYAVLRQEGFIRLDRRSGAVIAVDMDRIKARQNLKMQMRILLAQSRCNVLTRREVHELVDEIFEEYI